jgi:hypothetical protein
MAAPRNSTTTSPFETSGGHAWVARQKAHELRC